MLNQDLIYLNYWQRKELLAHKTPHFPVKKWWNSEGLCEIEEIIFQAIKAKAFLLDVGAGNLRMQSKLKNAGFTGQYDTQDIGQEFDYTYQNIGDITKSYSAILLLDVIEHLDLPTGLEMLHCLVALLETEGMLVIQTPNARCIRNPLSWDMTHVHSYNIHDLWAYLTAMGLHVEGYRVVFRATHRSYKDRIMSLLGQCIITQFLGCDYADNIILFAKKV